MTYARPQIRAQRLRYEEALQWLLDNDDTEFLDEGPDSSLSVTATFAADVYGKELEQVRADLLRIRKRTTRDRVADRIDGYDRDDLGESPDY